MRRRCRDERRRDYKNYGGRGIRVCPEWDASFEAFLDHMGARPAGYSIDRIDNDGDYRPGNCRWVQGKDQARNKHTNRMVDVDGETMPAIVACERYGIPHNVAMIRLNRLGWSSERTFKTPVRQRA